MPRGRGGARQGTPGKSYNNRTDLNQQKTQPVRVAPSQEYGQATAQAKAQQALPLPGPGAGLPQGSPQAQSAPEPMVLPGQLGPLDAPTNRPQEPITAGMATGPGPGPEAIDVPLPIQDPTVHVLQGILSRYPNPDIQALLAQAQSRG